MRCGVTAAFALVAVGCSAHDDGDSSTADGALGLGKHKYSLFDDGLHYALEFSNKPTDDAEREQLAVTLEKLYQPDPVSIASPVGESYECYSPKDEHVKTEATAADAIDQKHPAELIKTLKEQCIFRLEMYWSYEFCYKKHIRQYHEDVITSKAGAKTKKLSEHILGTATDTAGIIDSGKVTDKVPIMVYKGTETPYYAELMTGGDTCDLTGKPRSTEFRFICDPKSLHAFESIAETETCNYMAVVHTSLLCQHPDYNEKTVVPKKILCISSNDAQLGETRPQRMVKMAESLAVEEAKRKAEVERMKQLIIAQNKETAEKEKLARKNKGKGSATKKTFTVNTKLNANAAGTAGGTSKTAATGGAGAKQTPPVLSAAEEKQMENSARSMLNLFLQGKQCFMGGQGWWQHEFCYQKHVKQIHKNDDGTTQEVLLGIWDAEYHQLKVNKQKSGGGQRSTTSVTLYYKDGDFCEETKTNRKTKVKMICSKTLRGSQVAISLQESKTCSYIMKVESPLFCDAIRNADELGTLAV